MIIFGDAGINFSGGFKDQAKKDYIAAMPITLFCIHGNNEQRRLLMDGAGGRTNSLRKKLSSMWNSSLIK